MPYADVNIVVLSGKIRTFGDAEGIEVVEQGRTVCARCRLQVSNTIVTKDGNERWQNRYFTVTAWGKTAETLGGAKNGDKALVVGRLDSYRGRDGGWRQSIVARTVLVQPAKPATEDNSWPENTSDVPF